LIVSKINFSQKFGQSLCMSNKQNLESANDSDWLIKLMTHYGHRARDAHFFVLLLF
jgi:hypothetical protein